MRITGAKDFYLTGEERCKGTTAQWHNGKNILL
jgi:hypothetical protein